MNIERFLTLGTEIETGISAIYDKVASITVDKELSAQLKKIASEEINHAAALRMGKNYLAQAPDLFLSVNMKESDLTQGISDLDNLRTRFQGEILLLPALKVLLDLEKRFERIHLGASVSIADAHLTQLFQALVKGDQNHIAALTSIITRFEKN